MKEIVHAVQVGKAFNMNKVSSVIQIMVDNVLDDKDALMGLTNIKMHDEYTFAHSVNTAILSVSLGTYLSLDKPQLAVLGVAALMHDIGKVTIPNEIINKQGKLTDEEWKQIQRHPIDGALLLSNVGGVSKLAMVAAFEHHQHGETGIRKSRVNIKGIRFHRLSRLLILTKRSHPPVFTTPTIYLRTLRSGRC